MNLPSYFRYWGKARPAAESLSACHLLPSHSLDVDVAAVGVEALRRVPALRVLLKSRIDDTPDGRRAFWLALHDLGKFTESIQSQCHEVFSALRKSVVGERRT